MKLIDKLKLVLYECKYEKKEWILSLVLQYLIFISVLFLFTISPDIDKICGDYIRPMYPDGYGFDLKGFHEYDIEELQDKGFKEIFFSDDGMSGYAIIDDLDGIWLYKLQIIFEGKDIWSEQLDDVLSMVFFLQLLFYSLGFVLLIVMMNNISNSFAMKIISRKHYINMLTQLGCLTRECKGIFFGFFMLRNIVALLMAMITNVYLIGVLNDYIAEKMYITSLFTPYNVKMFFLIIVISIFNVQISFISQWRKCCEY